MRIKMIVLLMAFALFSCAELKQELDKEFSDAGPVIEVSEKTDTNEKIEKYSEKLAEKIAEKTGDTDSDSKGFYKDAAKGLGKIAVAVSTQNYAVAGVVFLGLLFGGVKYYKKKKKKKS